jgi:cytochrome P450
MSILIHTISLFGYNNDVEMLCHIIKEPQRMSQAISDKPHNTPPPNSYKTPPAPPTGWIGGNLLDYRRDALGFLTSNARNQGDFVRFKFLDFDLYQVNHPDDIQIVLTKRASSFHKSVIYKKTLHGFLGNGVLISDGDFWKRQRRLMQPAFHTSRIASYADVMVEYTARMIDGWHDGQTRNIADDMMRLTLYVVAKTLFDADVRNDSGRVGEALDVLLHAVIDASKTLIRLPEWIPTPKRARAKWSKETLHGVIGSIISERRQTEEDKGDLLSMLMLARDEDGTGMSDAQVLSEALTIFLAGHETTANTLTWTWYLLSQHPDIEAQLHEEVDRVLAGGAPTLEKLGELTFTEQIIKESMRLYPPVWSFGRMAIEDVPVNDYVLPKNRTVVVAPWVVHRDARWYDEPAQFKPERWTPEFEKDLHKYAYLPFGGGPRICIGNNFAMMEAKIILASMAQNYRLHLKKGHRVEPEPLITLRPKHGMMMHLERR